MGHTQAPRAGTEHVLDKAVKQVFVGQLLGALHCAGDCEAHDEGKLFSPVLEEPIASRCEMNPTRKELQYRRGRAGEGGV